jgi:hypothetical protein
MPALVMGVAVGNTASKGSVIILTAINPVGIISIYAPDDHNVVIPEHFHY